MVLILQLFTKIYKWYFRSWFEFFMFHQILTKMQHIHHFWEIIKLASVTISTFTHLQTDFHLMVMKMLQFYKNCWKINHSNHMISENVIFNMNKKSIQISFVITCQLESPNLHKYETEKYINIHWVLCVYMHYKGDKAIFFHKKCNLVLFLISL